MTRTILTFLLSRLIDKKSAKNINSKKVKELIKNLLTLTLAFGIWSTKNTIKNKVKQDINIIHSPFSLFTFLKKKIKNSTGNRSIYLAI